MCSICLSKLPSSHHIIAGPTSSYREDETDAKLAMGLAFLKRHPSIDMHAHPGRFFMKPGEDSALARLLGPPSVRKSLIDIKEGSVGGVMFSTVADHVLLELSDRGLRPVRDFRPGEAYTEYRRQMRALDRMIRSGGFDEGDRCPPMMKADGAPIAFRSIEGGDFIEDELARIGEAARDGVRAITIIHYNVNQIGDTQTEMAVHGGLSQLGRDIVAEMEHHDILVDLAHASYETCLSVARRARKPMLLSHSNVRRPGQDHPRLISVDHARLVTENGGIVGAVPAGFDQDTFDDYIDTIRYMIDLLGIDRVGIGTDMDYTYNPVLTSYKDWPLIPAALLGHGYSEADVVAVMGGNFLRLLHGPADPAASGQGIRE